MNISDNQQDSAADTRIITSMDIKWSVGKTGLVVGQIEWSRKFSHMPPLQATFSWNHRL